MKRPLSDVFSGIKQLLLSSKAGRANNLLKFAAIGNCLMFSIINIFLLFLLFKIISVAGWGFPYEIAVSNESCFEASLGLTYLPYWFSFHPSRGINIFFCDSVKLYLPLASQVYRTLYELFLLNMHLCALMVRKVDC